MGAVGPVGSGWGGQQAPLRGHLEPPAGPRLRFVGGAKPSLAAPAGQEGPFPGEGTQQGWSWARRVSGMPGNHRSLCRPRTSQSQSDSWLLPQG